MEKNTKKMLTLDESLELSQEKANELYKKHLNAGLLEIYQILGLDNMDAISAEGMYILQKDGRKIMDFTSALGILSLGHNHARIISAIKKFTDQKYLNAIKVAPSKIQSALAYNISCLLPDPLSVSFFTTSGAEAVEAAMKLCEKIQGKERRKFITTINSYHGKTHTAISMTRSGNIRDNFIQGIPEENIIEIPFGDISSLERVVKENGSEIVGIIVEPIQGQSIETPKDGYLKNVVELCHKHNILVIFDEVKCGMSRTGTFCAFQKENVVPDVLTMSKPLGGGLLAMGVMVTNEKLFKKAYGKKKFSGLHTTTFGGLGLSCAAAIESLNILGDENLQKEVREKGEYLKVLLENLQKKYPEQIVGIKGRGLMQGIEFNFRKILKESELELPDMPLMDNFDKMMMAALVRTLYAEHNIITHFSDSDIETLHIMPPLIVEKKELEIFVNALDKILAGGFIKLSLNFIKENIKDRLV